MSKAKGKSDEARSLADAFRPAEPLGLADDEIDDPFARDPCGFRTTMPEHTWQLQEAKNRLSELVRRVSAGEAQVITVRGEPTAVLVPIEDYLTHHRSPKKSLAEVLLSAPRVLSDEDADRIFARDQNPGRDVDLG